GASALFDMIEYYESATHLNIGANKHLGARGWQAAAHMMRKTSCLQYLDARNTPLLDHSAPFVARALRISSSLVVLHLENTSLSGRPLMLLATALKVNATLRELYLADNKLNGLQDSAQLGSLLKCNAHLQLLDLRNNHVLDSGLAYICEGLREQHRGLVTLVLWNNQLSHAGMAYLGMTLDPPHPQSQIFPDFPPPNPLQGHLPSPRPAPESREFRPIPDFRAGAVAVAEFIAESARLLRLDLRENDVKTGGLMALSLALRVNHSLLRLDLDREPKKEAVKSFLETQKALLAEIQNGCKRNFVLAKEREEKEQQLQHSASMAEIAGSESREENPEGNPEGNPGVPAPEENGSAAPAGDSSSDTEEDEEEEEEEGKDSREVVEFSGNSPGNSSGNNSGNSSGNAERRISVSSPGRGRKVFVVTRVENVPE
ncbi:PPR37 phosphatase, partial [Donacobius atricapilla]|nr:PPR37 phosphatase [Donacobius atricapilla]